MTPFEIILASLALIVNTWAVAILVREWRRQRKIDRDCRAILEKFGEVK